MLAGGVAEEMRSDGPEGSGGWDVGVGPNPESSEKPWRVVRCT